MPVGYALDYASAGQIRLVATASFSQWIGGFAFATGADKSLTGDPDHDGIANGLEMVLGGNPASGMDAALMPSLALVTDPAGLPGGTYFLFTYRRSDLAVAAGVATACDYTADLLAPWSTAVAGTAGLVILIDDNFAGWVPPAANTDRVRVYIQRGAGTTLFARLRMTVP